MTVSRNPEDYHPTDHAYNQAKQRSIDWKTVAKTIENGKIHRSYKENCLTFIDGYHYTEYPVKVVANVIDGRIVTVAWQK